MGACAEQMKSHRRGGNFLAPQGNARVFVRKRHIIALSAIHEIHGGRSLSAILLKCERQLAQILDGAGLGRHSRGKRTQRQKIHATE